MNSYKTSKTKLWLALFTVQLLFALSYIFSKLLMQAFPPMIWAFIRSSVTAIILLSLASLLKKPRPKLNRGFIFPLLIFSLMGGAITQGFYLLGLHYSTSTNSAILYTLSPLMTLAAVIWIGQERATLPRLIGFLFAFLGVTILSHIENYQLSNHQLLGDCLTLLSCFSYGLFLALSKPFFEKFDDLWITAGMFSISSLIFGVFAIRELPQFHIPIMTPSLIAMVLYGILGSTLLSYFLVIWTLKRAPSSQVALFGYLQPLLTSLICWIFFEEVISERTLLASGFILAGVSLTIEWRFLKSISQATHT